MLEGPSWRERRGISACDLDEEIEVSEVRGQDCFEAVGCPKLVVQRDSEKPTEQL